MFRRYFSVRADEVQAHPDSGLVRLRLIASTDDPVDMGGYREVLSHREGCIDTGAATALLLNHDPSRIVGALRGCAMKDGKRMDIEADLEPTAMMETGITVARAVEIGALRGASVGYVYDRADCSYDDATRTVTVNRWRLLELSLTAIPADPEAGVQRSVPFSLDHPKEPAIEPEGTRMLSDSATTAPAAPAPDHQAILAEQRQVAELARGLNLDPAQYVGHPMAKAQSDMLEAVKARESARHSEPKHSVTIQVEDCDKQVDAIVDAYGARVLGGSAKSGNPYAGRSLPEMAQRYAASLGIRTDGWTRKDRAHFALGEMSQVSNGRDAANVINSSFPNFVTANVITKIVAKGFEQSIAGSILGKIAERQTVPDFRSVRIGGLGTANLQETAENEAFPELVKAEGYFSTQAKMWGGTLSCTLQAMINDDTGELDRSLRQAGPLAVKTMERRAIQKFLRGTATTDASTWTNNTTSGCTIVYTSSDTIAAARANIAKASVGMMNKIGLDGNPLGTNPRFLLCGPTNSLYARGLLQSVGGQVVGNSGDLELVVTPWLEATTLTGYSTTSYYLLADPMTTTGLVLSQISGYENIQVQEYDAGAVGARKWQLWLPFEADLFAVTNAAGTAIIPAAQQATT